MTIHAHVQDKANIFYLNVFPTVGNKYILTKHTAYKGFEDAILVDTLFNINAYLNTQIIKEHMKAS